MAKKISDNQNLDNKKISSWVLFLFATSIVIISLVSVVFPQLISSSLGFPDVFQDLGISHSTEPFQTGTMTIPLIVSNIIIFGLAFLYFTNKFPIFLSNLFLKLFNFEISKRVSIILMIIILGIYVGITAQELQTEEIWLDYKNVIKRMEVNVWSFSQIEDLSEPHVKYFLLTTSMTLFGNYSVIPFFASIALLLTVYLITAEIAKKRFAGIIAMLVVIQSNIFLTYDTSVTYDNFWILFYLLSLYTIIRAWPASPIFYFLSIASKAITAIFLPMSLFFVYNAKIQRKKKLILFGIYGIMGIIGIITITSYNESLLVSDNIVSSFNFWQGFTSMAFQLRFDVLIILLLMPLVVGLFIASRKGFTYADSVMFLIGFFLLTAPTLTGFSDLTNQPYRFMPLVVFFAMGIGVLLSKTNPKTE